MIKALCTIILAIAAQIGCAHQDFYVMNEFHNVKIRFKTGYDYEEINKAEMIGMLTERLSRKMEYLGPIFLDLTHIYWGKDHGPAYFISYDRGGVGHEVGSFPSTDILKKDAIVIRQVAQYFDPEATLKLVEYGILNVEHIRKHQRPQDYNENHCRWQFPAMDQDVVRQVLSAPASPMVLAVSAQRLDKPGEDRKYGISYYLKNNEYTFIYRRSDGTERDLLTVPELYQVGVLNSSALVFDTDSSFYYINGYVKHVSRRHVLEGIHFHYGPYRVGALDRGKVFISYHYDAYDGTWPKRRDHTLLYLVDGDRLISDLDAELEKR